MRETEAVIIECQHIYASAHQAIELIARNHLRSLLSEYRFEDAYRFVQWVMVEYDINMIEEYMRAKRRLREMEGEG